MLRSALITTVAVLLFVLPGTASAHGSVHAHSGVSSAAGHNDCYFDSGDAGATHSAMPMEEGPCCGLASCSPLTLTPAILVSPANDARKRLSSDAVSPPAGPAVAVFAPPG
jgi:hypothetical protein